MGYRVKGTFWLFWHLFGKRGYKELMGAKGALFRHILKSN